MNDIVKVHEFANKWLHKFQDPDINDIELVDHHMADDCDALNFQMDVGHGFMAKYGPDSIKYPNFKRIIHQVTDIALLGSAIYSNWRYFNHWAYDAASILEPENRSWFILAFQRLSFLSSPSKQHSIDTSINSIGTLKKLRLISCRQERESLPDSNDEVEQRITLNREGRVWFSSHRFSSDLDTHSIQSKSRFFQISQASAHQILNETALYFSNKHKPDIHVDSSYWTLELTDTDNNRYIFHGSATPNLNLISTMVRHALDMDDLYMFDYLNERFNRHSHSPKG